MSKPVQKLSARQAKFVVEYLLCLSATQAAIKAGYSENGASVAGVRLLANANVAAAIEKAKTSELSKSYFDRDKVLKEVSIIGFSDVDNYAMDPETGKLIAAPGAPEGVMRAVSSVKYRTVTETRTGNVERTVEFRLWDKPGTLKLAGRHVGLFPSKDKDQLQAEAKALLAAMLDEARKKRDLEADEPATVPQRDEARMIDVSVEPKASE